MRKLYLQNESGERYALNGNGVLMTNVSGFGYAKSPSYSDLSYGFYQKVEDVSEPQGVLVGDVNFYRKDTIKEPYAAYRAFVNWVNSGSSLAFVYCPFGGEEYYRDVDVTLLSKGEKEVCGILTVPMTCTAKTPWYRNSPISITIEPNQGQNAKRYSFCYPHLYGQNGENIGCEIFGGGQMESGLKVSIPGPVLNPVIRLTDVVSGAEYGRLQLVADIPRGSTLFYSTLRYDAYVRIDGEDAIDLVNLEYAPLFGVPVGRLCRLEISADAALPDFIQVQLYDYFRSV